MKENTLIQRKIQELKTGDLLLFHGEDCWYSWLIEKISGSKWSHCGIVLKNPSDINPIIKNGLYLWESGGETQKNAQNNKNIFGVQITDLVSKIDNYTGGVSVCKINKGLEPSLLKAIHKEVYNKPYDLDPRNWFDMLEFSYVKNHTNSFWCSAFVGFVYTKAGVYPEGDWSALRPDQLADHKTINGYCFGPIEKIK